MARVALLSLMFVGRAVAFGSPTVPLPVYCVEGVAGFSCAIALLNGWGCSSTWKGTCGTDHPLGTSYNDWPLRSSASCRPFCPYSTPAYNYSTTGVAGFYRYKVCESATKMWEGEFCAGCGDGYSCSATIGDTTACDEWRSAQAGACVGPQSWQHGTQSSYIDCSQSDGKPRIYGYPTTDCSGAVTPPWTDHKTRCWFEGGYNQTGNPFAGTTYPDGM
eukprot:6916879-Prymnesium_polylepis.1